MAISLMQRLSLILPKELLNDLLFYLQDLQTVQIYDLHQDKDWQAAFEMAEVVEPSLLTQDGDQEGLTLQDLQKSQARLERIIGRLELFLPKKKLFSRLKEKPLELSLETLEQRAVGANEQLLWQEISQQLQDLEKAQAKLEEDQAEIDALKKWTNLDITPQDFRNFRYVKGLVGTIPNHVDDTWRSAIEAYPDLEYQEVFTTATECGLILLYRGGQYEQIEELLQTLQFKAFEYDFDQLPKERLEELRADRRKQKAFIESLHTSLAASKDKLEQLKIQMDYVCNLSIRQETTSHLASTKNLVALEGWVESEQVPVLKSCLTERFGQRLLVQTREIGPDETDQVPTKLKNNALVEPFELVTEMYALPKYGDKDPTPLVSLFYFVFFGMMVADIGYGLLLFATTSLVLRSFYIKPDLAKNLRFFRLLGVAVTIWGLVYGSFFGFELPFALISTSSDAMTILVISVVFGFVTVLAGLFLSGLKNIRLKDYAEAYNAGFAWVLILLGLLLLALGNFFPSLAFAATIGQWLAIINALGVLAVSIVSAKSLAGLGSGLFNLYNVSGYVGDLVSFTRLMALGLSGASIGSAFNLIVSLFPPVARFSIGILLFIALHLVNMFLSFLSGYVHGARLIFVEFFGKFYDGGGKPFTPLKPSEKYVQQSKK